MKEKIINVHTAQTSKEYPAILFATTDIGNIYYRTLYTDGSREISDSEQSTSLLDEPLKTEPHTEGEEDWCTEIGKWHKLDLPDLEDITDAKPEEDTTPLGTGTRGSTFKINKKMILSKLDKKDIISIILGNLIDKDNSKDPQIIEELMTPTLEKMSIKDLKHKFKINENSLK